jgi:hypothetical protein
MQDQSTDQKDKAEKLPDEDGSVMIYGFVQIKDAQTGEVLVSTRA